MKKEVDTTSNRSVYKKAYKNFIAEQTGKCSYCKWHSGENATKAKRTSKSGA